MAIYALLGTARVLSVSFTTTIAIDHTGARYVRSWTELGRTPVAISAWGDG